MDFSRSRRFTSLLCLGLLALGSSQRAAAQSSDELVVWLDATRAPALQAFQKANPSVRVRPVVVDVGQNTNKLRLAVRGNTELPDVIFDNVNNLPQLIAPDIDFAADLTPLVDKRTIAGFASGSLAPCKVGKTLVCLRNDIAQNVLWYNAKLMKDFGYSVPTTWEEYLALGLKVAKEKPGYVVGGVGAPFDLYVYFWASRCPVSRTSGARTVRIALGAPECQRVASMLDQLIAAGSVPRFGMFDPKFGALGQENKILMLPGPSWFGEYVFKPSYKTPAGELAVAPPLRWASERKAWTGSSGGALWLVSKRSKNTQAAASLITWLATNNAYQADAPTFPAYSPAASAWAKKVSADRYYAQDIVPAFTKAANLLEPSFTFPRFDLQGIYGNVMDPGIQGGRSYAQMLPELQTRLTQVAQSSGYQVVGR